MVGSDVCAFLGEPQAATGSNVVNSTADPDMVDEAGYAELCTRCVGMSWQVCATVLFSETLHVSSSNHLKK